MKVILIGGFSETIELCEENDYQIIGIIDNTERKKIFGYNVIGRDEDAQLVFKEYANIPLIISPDLPHIRSKLSNYYQAIGFTFQTVISKKAIVSKYARIESGVIIQNGCHVSAMANLAQHVKLNVNSNVMHDCLIGAFSTLAPNSVLLGSVKLGEQVYIGANATILPNITIADKAIVGAGAVVTKNINANAIVKGVPAK